MLHKSFLLLCAAQASLGECLTAHTATTSLYVSIKCMWHQTFLVHLGYGGCSVTSCTVLLYDHGTPLTLLLKVLWAFIG